MIRIAYHLHAKGDERGPFWRGGYSAETLVRKLYGQGIRVIGITDKNSVRVVRELKYKGFEEGFKEEIYLPVGAEVVTRDRSELTNDNVELLVVFNNCKLDSETERMIEDGINRSYLEVAEQTKSRGGKVILQHMFSPVGIGRTRGEELKKRNLVDGIEWNLQLEWTEKGKKQNEQALEFARELGLPVIYGCDDYYAEAKATMVVDSEDPIEAFWKLFEGGKFYCEIGRPSKWNRTKQFVNGLIHEPSKTLSIARFYLH